MTVETARKPVPAPVETTTTAFRFYTRKNLTELTGLRAATLTELRSLIEVVPGACIYYHTHQFLQQYNYLSPEPTNDFAYWVTEVMQEEELGEQLASVDIMSFDSLRDLRNRFAEIIAAYLDKNTLAKLRFSSEGDEFQFQKAVSFIMPAAYEARDLPGFLECLEKVSEDSIYFHMLEARLRLGKKTNDFSNWIESALGQPRLANRIASLDPYTRSLESLRHALVKIIEREVRR